MTMDAFESFAKDIALLRDHAKRAPLVLFLGNAAAPEIRAILVNKLLEQHGSPAAGQPPTHKTERAFREIWHRQAQPIRNALFWSAVSAAEAELPEQMKRTVEGFGHLAQLAKAGYFDVIVTTRADWLLESALQRVLEFHEWRVLRVGIDSVREIADHVVPGTRRVVSVVKLRGDAARGIYSLGDELLQDVLAVAEPLFARPMLVVGYDDNADKDVRPALEHTGTPLYFAAAAGPEPESALERALEHADPKLIIGDVARFDEFFRRLAATLIGGRPGDSAAVKILADSGLPLSKVPGHQLDDIIKNPTRSDADLVEILRSVNRTEPPAQDAVVSFPKRVIITLSIDDRARRITFRSEGDLVRTGSAELPAPLDADGYNMLVRYMGEDLERASAQGDDAVREAWRTKQIWEGRRLHDSLVRQVPELMNLLGTAHGVTLDGGELMVRFDGARHLLGMPYELMQDDRGPWAVRYAMFRSVQKVDVRGPGFRTLIDELKARKEPLRVLLVGAESGTYLGVAEHVRLLKHALEQRAAQLRLLLAVETLVLKDDDRALPQLQDRLPAGGYHVLCYDGHSVQSDEPGRTGLAIGSWPQIWNEQQLHDALRKAAPRLVFFNSCVGARTGGEHLLYNRSYLGVMDAAVQAGVPAVLGYRWSVLDSAAARFGKVFLEKLLETRSPPLAVLHARADAWQSDALDETWTSPILVAQQVD